MVELIPLIMFLVVCLVLMAGTLWLSPVRNGADLRRGGLCYRPL